MSLLILSASDVAHVTSSFSPEDLLSQSSLIFSLLSSANDNYGDSISSPHRTSVRTNNHIALFMPSRVASVGTAIKVVSVPISDRAREGGLPASTMVLDEETGCVKALVNARSLTALRNAAGSLLSTVLLLPPNLAPTRLVAFGAGAQISAHITLFLRHLPSLNHVTIINRTSNNRLTSLVSSLTSQFPKARFVTIVTIVTTPESQAHDIVQEVVNKADIIVTATSSTVPLFRGYWVKSGAHVILIGSYTPAMHEIDTPLLRRAGRVIVDSRHACLQEAGELIDANLKGEDLVELGELISINVDGFRGNDGDKRWKADDMMIEQVRKSGDLTIFKSVGVGVQDVMIASAVVWRAEELEIGTRVTEYD